MIEEEVLQEIERIIGENEEIYKKFLSSLLKIRSIEGNELDVANRIIAFLLDHNFQANDYILDNIEGNNRRANLIAYLNPLTHQSKVDNEERILLYNGHMDVVGLGKKSWKRDKGPFSGIYDEKYFYGRGSSDMKAGLAAMVIALTILKELKDSQKIIIPGNLIVNAVAAEETNPIIGTIRSRDKLKRDYGISKCTFVVVGEPTSFARGTKSITIGEKGTSKVTLTSKGEMGHTSNTNQGKNAINMMLTLLGKLNLDDIIKKISKGQPPISEQKFKEILEMLPPNDPTGEKAESLKKNYELINKPTYSFSIIDVGSTPALNLTPDRCNLSIDFRTPPGQQGKDIIDALKNAIKVITRDEKNLEEKDFSVKGMAVSASQYVINQDNPHSTNFKEEFMNVVRMIYKKDNVDVFEFFFPASADAIHYRIGHSPICSETILFGPGEFDLIHGIDELVEVKDFFNA
ncbi:MAG: M20 family metallopeptidase, partial [Promethearchaeota archaeon]